MAELKSPLRKFDMTRDDADGDEIHDIAVSAILQRGMLAEQIQKRLNQRHKATIGQLAKADTIEALH